MGSFVNGFIVVALVCTIGFIYGVFTYLSDYEPNECEMTFMFEYPQFVRISVPEDQYFKKYSLYVYSEGRSTQKARDMFFNGIPVLFIPGNAGSYKQVRSLASVALRKSLNSRSEYHFDYFTMDTNGEHSGTNGVLLKDQIAYANISMHRILDLYHGNASSKPKSIVVIGHSMGGIVAKGLAVNLPYKSDLISLIITLATPHKRTPLIFDYHAYELYRKILPAEAHITSTVISIYGGHNDFMVSPNIAKYSGISAVATHIPKVWLPTDHLCILWCKQLVKVLNRALFESVDPYKKQISTDRDHLRNVFESHLLVNSGIKASLRDQYESLVTMESGGEWIEYLPRQYTIKLIEGTKTTKHYMIRLAQSPKHEMVAITAVNLKVTDWLYVCAASEIRGQSRICLHGMHLSHLSQIAPSKRLKRRTFDMNLHALQIKYPTYTHVIIKVPITRDLVTLHVDVFENNQRKIEVKLPHRLSWKKQVVVEETVEKAIRYELDFPKLTHILQVFLLYVEPTDNCNAKSYHSTATIITPWNDERYHKHFTESLKDPLILRLYSSKPSDNDNTGARVSLTLDPECRYKISIKSSIPKQLAQFARYYSPFLFSYVSAAVLLVLTYQLRTMHRTQRFPMFLTGLKAGAKPYYFLPVVKILSQTLGVSIVNKYLPHTDWLYIQQEGLDSFLLPIIMFFIAVGISWILAVALMVTVFIFESTVHRVVLKVISKAIRTPTTWSDWILSGFQKFPTLVAACLMAISTTTCGGLALALGCIFYFMKLTQMSQNVIENIVKKLIRTIGKWLKKAFKKEPPPVIKEGEGQEQKVFEVESEEDDGKVGLFSLLLKEVLENNELFFHFTVFSLWFLVTCINVPVTLTWAHNFKYNPKLVIDPSFVPGIVLCGCAVPLWQMELPKASKKGYAELAFAIYVLAVVSQIFGVFSLFILNYVLTTVIAMVVLHQVIIPREPIGGPGEDDSDTKYMEAKSKMQ